MVGDIAGEFSLAYSNDIENLKVEADYLRGALPSFSYTMVWMLSIAVLY